MIDGVGRNERGRTMKTLTRFGAIIGAMVLLGGVCFLAGQASGARDHE